jgi:hypothetical protein
MTLNAPLLSRCSRVLASSVDEPADHDGDDVKASDRVGGVAEPDGEEPSVDDGKGDAGWPRGDSEATLNDPLLLAPRMPRGDGPPRGDTLALPVAVPATGTVRRRCCCCNSCRSLMSFCISITHESRSIRERARHTIFLPVGSLQRDPQS